MYIYRAVRTRGKSLQEDANQLESTATTPSYLLTNSHADCKHLTPGLAVPSNARRKGLQQTGLHLCAKVELSIPGYISTDTGEKVSGSYTAS